MVVSIHPMLLFIDSSMEYAASIITFQYIPCYSLSDIRNIKFEAKIEFQYIPCYSLSLDWNVVPTDIISFQYIPCYSLSEETS